MADLSKTGLPGQPRKRGRPSKKNPSSIPPRNYKQPGKPFEDLSGYRCCCCGNEYLCLEENFISSNSPLFEGWGGYVPICKDCLEKYFNEYLLPAVDNDESIAMERMCSICDWYWSEDMMEIASKMVENGLKKGTNPVLPFVYCARRNMTQFKKKGITYLDTVKQRWDAGKVITDYNDTRAVANPNDAMGNAVTEVDKADVWFFGPGYTPEQYHYLREQYDDWCNRYDCQSKAQEEIFKSLAIAQLNVQRSQMDGDQKKTTETIKTLQDLMDAAKIKPKQKDDAALVEQNTFGTLIERWEKNKPIPEPAEEWKDVDGIQRYVGSWFFGHLAKMFKLDNDWSRMYDEEVGKYTVQPPHYEEQEDVDDGFDAMYQQIRNANTKQKEKSDTE